MMRAARTVMHTARFAQRACAASACSENSSIIITLDAVLASIFSLISILIIRLLPSHIAENLKACQPMSQIA